MVLFDGVCNLCNASVAFILKHERGPTLRFAALQSDAGQSMLEAIGRDPDQLDSIVLVEGQRAWERSDAVLRIAGHLRAPWRWTQALTAVPRWIRDPVYRGIARHRYWLFGKRDACMMPTDAVRERFVERSA